MEAACTGGHANATDLADYLVKKGMPFRTAHAVAAGVVRECIDLGLRDMRDMGFEELRKHSTLIEQDVLDFLSPRAGVYARDLPGGPNPKRVADQLTEIERFLSQTSQVT